MSQTYTDEHILNSTVYPKAKWLRPLLFLLPLAFIIIPATKIHAQCSNWSISAHLIAASSCAGNGSFAVTVTGPDAANLTNIQYGIPLTANGFSVPLNNSSTFNNIPANNYTVSAVGTCGGTYVGKNTTITMPGNYIAPTLSAFMGRPTLNCGAYGQINVNIIDGRTPFTVTISGAPATYSGPLSYVIHGSGVVLPNLPAGNYTIAAVDSCNNGTAPVSVAVTGLDPNFLPIQFGYDFENAGCDTLYIPKPAINQNDGSWYAYQYDTLFTISAQVGALNFTAPFVSISNTQPFIIKLPPGKSLKDCYGQIITYTVKSVCGTSVQYMQAIPFPNAVMGINQNCNTSFTGTLSLTAPVCYPVTYSVINTATHTTYGPYIATSTSSTTPALPLGDYTFNFTTGDGYTGAGQFGAHPINGSPYSVSVSGGYTGLNNYISGFNFFTSLPSSDPKNIELFSGPAGYSYTGTWTLNSEYSIIDNQTPAAYGTIKFPPGNYVWKITDNCGSYLIPVTVGAPDLYQYTVGVGQTRQTCQGLWVHPTGTATNNGQNMPIDFGILKNGTEWNVVNYNWTLYNLGDSFLVTDPGVYTIVPASNGQPQEIDSALSLIHYPNIYTASYSFTYAVNPVAVDLNNSQGFLCSGAGAGHGIIYAKGKNGTPFTNPTYYKYYLAAQGNGTAGPYLGNNTTGIFANFGGNANVTYDLKVQDACGAFAVQPLKILDLRTARLISSSTYTPCLGYSVQLSALYLPGATYSWTGPGGFTSSLQSPIINSVSLQNIGIYHVTITTPECMQPVTDSTILTVNANPPKPLVSLDCSHLPATLTVTNPSPGYRYEWYTDVSEFGFDESFIQESDTAYTKYADIPGTYKAIATDTSTGCFTYSDSISFLADPLVQLRATIYSPHLQLCPGDTTILVAHSTAINGISTVYTAKFQWFKNDLIIPGATGSSYVAWQAGNYKVRIDGGACQLDTSDNVTVSIIPIPSASITVPVQEICVGDTAFIYANTGAGYTYTWNRNDTTIPGIASATLAATQPGTYNVVVSNGGCIATSPTTAIIVDPAAIVNLTPATPQILCTGDIVHFSTPANAAYTYTWQRNGIVIPGATTNTYQTAAGGTYAVAVKTGNCKVKTSQAVPVANVQTPVAAITAPVTEICSGTTASMYANTGAGYTYTWYLNNVVQSNTSATFGATQQGSYMVRISDSGCTSISQAISITVDPAPVVNLQPGTNQFLCAGNVLDFTTPANAAYTYTWLNNGVAIPGATGNTYQTRQGGTYQVSVQSGICPVIKSQPVQVTLLPTSVELGKDTVVCTDGPFTIPLTVGSGFTDVLWSTGATTNSILVTKSGTYIVRATNQCGEFTDSIHVYTPSSYLIGLPADTLICNQANSAVFSVNPLVQNVLWNTGSTEKSINIVQPGIYWVQGLSACGTLVTDTMNVRFCSPQINAITLSNDTICVGDCITVSAITDNYPQLFSWYFGGALQDSSDAPGPVTVCYGKEGIYPIQLAVKNAGGTAALTSKVVVLSKPVPRFADTTITVPYKSDITLSPCADALSVSWYLNDSLVCGGCQNLNINAEYYYNVYHCVVSNGGCKDSCLYKLQVVDIPHDLWLPDAFTPNGDGRNDIFRIITDNPNVLVINLEIYNRWGQLLFISRLSNEGWNGTFHGVPADLDTYYWMLKYKISGAGDEIYFKKGSVVLVR